MFTLTGKYNSATIMIDNVEATAQGQILSFLNHPAFENTKIVIMPDTHAGAGAVIGFTSTLNDFIIPNIVGVDIGCGIDTYNIGHPVIDFKEFDKYLRDNIPSGFSIRDVKLEIPAKLDKEITDICAKLNLPEQKHHKAVGTLGGGNHFIELNQDPAGNIWLTVHTGSRKFGLDIATNYQKRAASYATLFHSNRELAWLRDSDKELYLHDMSVAQEFAAFSRLAIIKSLLAFFNIYKFEEDKHISSVHNYINFEDKIIRKGAISAYAGQKVIIPLNMRDGSIIGTGKGNPDWNYSAPHGAGRLMSRGDAKRKLTLDDYKETMLGVWSSCVKQSTLDEAPGAYKDAMTIVNSIKETVDIDFIMKPIYNFKACE